MSSILVYLQHEAGKLSKGSIAAIKAAEVVRQVFQLTEILGVTLGAGAKDLANANKKLGLSKIVFSEDPLFTIFRAEPYARAVALAAKENNVKFVVGTATSQVKDFMPQVSVFLEAGQASDVVAVNQDGTFKRAMFAGNVVAEIKIKTEVKLLTVRQSAFAGEIIDAASESTLSSLNLAGDAELIERPRFGKVIGSEIVKAERPELADARVVVSGGRALQSKENFDKIMIPLADALGAAIGASRAAVDSGYAPNDWQVGQTGKVVAPELYISVGISGAIQHLAGMKDSKVIVAINKDPDAPIFEVADYGLVADLYQVVPELIAGIKQG